MRMWGGVGPCVNSMADLKFLSNRTLWISHTQLERQIVIAFGCIPRKKCCMLLRGIPHHSGCEMDPKSLGVTACVQIKSYPRQWWVKGRVRVSLKDKEGRLINPAIPDSALVNKLLNQK